MLKPTDFPLLPAGNDKLINHATFSVIYIYKLYGTCCFKGEAFYITYCFGMLLHCLWTHRLNGRGAPSKTAGGISRRQ